MFEKQAFIYLFDGLDEVPAEYRVQCINAINTFCERELAHVVVCCRTDAYCELATNIKAFAAYQLLSLTTEQINQHLLALGPDANQIRTLIDNSEELKELARTPLLLGIMTEEAHVAPLSSEWGEVASLRQIIDQYILRVLRNQGKKRLYTPQVAIRWLRWQAKCMLAYHLNTFYLEDIQPTWLVPTNQQHPLLSLSFNSRFRKIVKTLLPFISKNRAGTKTVSPYTDISWRWRSAGAKLRSGFVTGFNLGCGTVVLLSLLLGLLLGLLVSIGIVLPNLEFGNFDLGKTIVDIATNENVWFVLSTTAIGGTLLGAIAGFLPAALISGPAFGILNGLLGGVVATSITKMSRPSQSIQRSGRFGLVAGISIGLTATLGFGVITALLTNASIGRLLGGGLGIFVGAYATLTCGGAAFLVHYTVRYLLYLNGNIPFRYARFLDYACDRVLLYRIGPGYIFTHRIILEHFANLTDADIERITAQIID